MNIFQIFLLAFLGAAASITVKKTNPEISMIIGIAAGFLILFFSAGNIIAVINGISEAFKKIDLNLSYLTLLVKVVGITYIGEFAVCALKDAGESAIASKVEIFAKVLIVAMALPTFLSFINNAFEMLT